MASHREILEDTASLVEISRGGAWEIRVGRRGSRRCWIHRFDFRGLHFRRLGGLEGLFIDPAPGAGWPRDQECHTSILPYANHAICLFIVLTYPHPTAGCSHPVFKRSNRCHGLQVLGSLASAGAQPRQQKGAKRTSPQSRRSPRPCLLFLLVGLHDCFLGVVYIPTTCEPSTSFTHS